MGEPLLFKIALTGDNNVGKTNVVSRYVENKFTEKSQTTLGTLFNDKNLDINDRLVKLRIFDTSGEERFTTITQSYYRESHSVFIVYDISSEESIESVPNWFSEVRNLVKECHCVVVANKIDLLDDSNEEEKKEMMKRLEKGEDFAKENEISFVQISAKEGTNVNELFRKIAEELILQREPPQEMLPSPSKRGTLNKSSKNFKKSSSKSGEKPEKPEKERKKDCIIS